MSRRGAIALLVATALLFSLSGLLVKLIHWNPWAVAGVRGAGAALVVLAVIRRPRLQRTWAQAGGILGWTLTSFTLVLAMQLGTAANAIALMFTAPLYTALLGHWLLGERPSRWDLGALVVILPAIGLLFLDRLTPTGALATACGVLSGVGFALYAVCLRAQPGDGALQSAFFGNVLVALLGVPWGLQAGPDRGEWPALLALGVVTLGLPSVLFGVAIRHVRALESVLILVLEPVFLPIWVALRVGEVPGPLALLGGGLIISAITLRGALAARRP